MERTDIPDSCVNCDRYVYKGDDEAYCTRTYDYRHVWLRRWQKKPKWCPLEKRRRIQK